MKYCGWVILADKFGPLASRPAKSTDTTRRLCHALLDCWKPFDAPKALVAHTVKGQGVSFMADDNRWHYTRLNAETFAAALAELSSMLTAARTHAKRIFQFLVAAAQADPRSCC